MLNLLKNLLPRRAAEAAARQHLTADTWPAAVYAIGDVHGCLDELNELYRRIADDARDITGEKWIVMLGDYVDRGPQSAGVLDKLCASAPPGFRRICLAGNHEIMMLSVLEGGANVQDWLSFGGLQTLASYGIELHRFEAANPKQRLALLESHVPAEHYTFLRELPVLLALPGTVFVHAGIRRGVDIAQQSETDLLWMREPFLSDDTQGVRIVHGHTPVDVPELRGNRVNLDTGAFATGVLTAARLDSNGEVRLFSTSRRAS